MNESHTKKSTRIIIWIITIAMTVGTLGAYFMILLQSNDQTTATSNVNNEEPKVDPTAYTVKGKVKELEIKDLKAGNGKTATLNDTIRVHYKGTLAQTGVKFDSSYDRGEPIAFPLKGVIKGWQKGMVGMKEGGKRRLVIPASLAYGAEGQEGIPPNSDLVFEVELLAINPTGAETSQ